MGGYRLDDLGWAQFEQVCEELLDVVGLSGLSWRGRADLLRSAIADEVPAGLGDSTLRAPLLIAVAWVRCDSPTTTRRCESAAG
jgi:hypothetical protein